MCGFLQLGLHIMNCIIKNKSSLILIEIVFFFSFRTDFSITRSSAGKCLLSPPSPPAFHLQDLSVAGSPKPGGLSRLASSFSSTALPRNPYWPGFVQVLSLLLFHRPVVDVDSCPLFLCGSSLSNYSFPISFLFPPLLRVAVADLIIARSRTDGCCQCRRHG